MPKIFKKCSPTGPLITATLVVAFMDNLYIMIWEEDKIHGNQSSITIIPEAASDKAALGKTTEVHIWSSIIPQKVGRPPALPGDPCGGIRHAKAARGGVAGVGPRQNGGAGRPPMAARVPSIKTGVAPEEVRAAHSRAMRSATYVLVLACSM